MSILVSISSLKVPEFFERIQ